MDACITPSTNHNDMIRTYIHGFSIQANHTTCGQCVTGTAIARGTLRSEITCPECIAIIQPKPMTPPPLGTPMQAAQEYCTETRQLMTLMQNHIDNLRAPEAYEIACRMTNRATTMKGMLRPTVRATCTHPKVHPYSNERGRCTTCNQLVMRHIIKPIYGDWTTQETK